MSPFSDVPGFSRARAAPAQADSILGRLDRALGVALDGATAALLCAEIGVLLLSVVAAPLGRAGALAPVAEDLFVWLAMFGAVAALRHGAHLRVTALTVRLPESLRCRLEAVAALLVFVAAALVLLPADHLLARTWTAVSVNVHESVRAAALLSGFALMALVAALQIAERADFGDLLIAVNVVSVAGAALFLGKSFLVHLGSGNLAFFFIVLFGACVAIGLPIAFGCAIATIAYVSTIAGQPLDGMLAPLQAGILSPALLAIPVLALVGYLLELGGMLTALVTFATSLAGRVRGGYAFVLFGCASLIASISGASVADLKLFAPVFFMEIARDGSERDAAGVLSASRTLAMILPPSAALLIVAAVTGLSLAALFPGAYVAALLAALPLLAALALRARSAQAPLEPRTLATRARRALAQAAPLLLMPVLMWSAVPVGFLSVPEAAACGVIYVLIQAAGTRRALGVKRVYRALTQAGTAAGSMLFVVATGAAMVWALEQAGFARQVADALAQVPGASIGFLLLSTVIFGVLGALLAGYPALVLGAPLLFPVAHQFGISDVSYAIVAVLAMGIGLGASSHAGGRYG